jgi:hypothetical protein
MERISIAEWLHNELTKGWYDADSSKEILQKAKEMEERQRIEDFKAGCAECGFEHSANDWAKEYVSKTNKSK